MRNGTWRSHPPKPRSPVAKQSPPRQRRRRRTGRPDLSEPLANSALTSTRSCQPAPRSRSAAAERPRVPVAVWIATPLVVLALVLVTVAVLAGGGGSDGGEPTSATVDAGVKAGVDPSPSSSLQTVPATNQPSPIVCDGQWAVILGSLQDGDSKTSTEYLTERQGELSDSSLRMVSPGLCQSLTPGYWAVVGGIHDSSDFAISECQQRGLFFGRIAMLLFFEQLLRPTESSTRIAKALHQPRWQEQQARQGLSHARRHQATRPDQVGELRHLVRHGR